MLICVIASVIFLNQYQPLYRQTIVGANGNTVLNLHYPLGIPIKLALEKSVLGPQRDSNQWNSDQISANEHLGYIFHKEINLRVTECFKLKKKYNKNFTTNKESNGRIVAGGDLIAIQRLPFLYVYE